MAADPYASSPDNAIAVMEEREDYFSPPSQELEREIDPGAHLATLADPSLTEAPPRLPPASRATLWRPELPLYEPGDFGLRDIIGDEDSRQPISNRRDFPWRTLAWLIITARDGSMWGGTGWLVGRRTVVTAGHCVHIHAPGTERHGRVRHVRVIPGGAGAPFGEHVSDRVDALSGWTSDGDRNFDLGAILLEQPIGDEVGWLGWRAYNDAQLSQFPAAHVMGYPTNKPPSAPSASWFRGSLWAGKGSFGPRTSTVLGYDTDTDDGQSGGPVCVAEGRSLLAVGIHTASFRGRNIGTRINVPVHRKLLQWKQSGDG